MWILHIESFHCKVSNNDMYYEYVVIVIYNLFFAFVKNCASVEVNKYFFINHVNKDAINDI